MQQHANKQQANKQMNRAGNRSHRISRRQLMAGLTLVELMVAVGLAILLSTGVMQVFIASKRGYYEDEQMANLQENARYALRYLGREVSMAGYMGSVVDITAQTSPALPVITDDCDAGWALDASVSMELENDADAAYNGKCVEDVQEETDVLAVRRLADDFVIRNLEADANAEIPDAGGANKDRIYFVYDRTDGGAKDSDDLMYLDKGSNIDGDAKRKEKGFYVSEYYARTFFVRTWSSTAGDGVPCLAVASLDENAAMTTECLVEGVEDFQLEFGIDDEVFDPDPTVMPDRFPNRYIDDPDTDEIQRGVTSVTLHLLIRSTGQITGHLDDKTYQLGAKAVAAKNDSYYRRVFTTTVRVPNIMIRNIL